jgi:large subunit ribosomal protein L10
MARTLKSKEQILGSLKENISSAQMAVVIDYAGLSVAEISDLRNRLFDKGAICKVTKNTLMQKAIDGQENWIAMSPLLKGSNAFILTGEDIGGALKAYQDFQKVSKKTEVRGGVMEGRLLSPDDVKAIADLPSREQLMAQIAGALNSVTAKVAIGIKEVPAGLGRAIKAVSEKDAA